MTSDAGGVKVKLSLIEKAMLSESHFMKAVRANPINTKLLRLLPNLDLPQGYLCAGSLFQSYWNIKTACAVTEGIKDYDVFYYDPDTSWEAENAVIKRAGKLLGALAGEVEIKNQARVHMWYETRFGVPRDPLRSSQHGIEQFLIECSCIGVSLDDGSLYAPYGLNDMAAGRLSMNPHNPKPALFLQKAKDYQSRWPWLQIEAVNY